MSTPDVIKKFSASNCDLIIIEHGEKGNACETVETVLCAKHHNSQGLCGCFKSWSLLLACVSMKTLIESSNIVWIF